MTEIKIKVPSLVKRQKMGKNEIIHVIEAESECEIIKGSSNHLELKNNEGKTLYVQCVSDDINKTFKYVLTTPESPDIKRLQDGTQQLVWARHISEDLSPEEIRKTWHNGLSLCEETNEEGLESTGFRTPQLGAIHATLAHWAVSKSVATVVMPTGTGKTETMLALLISQKCERLLVTVPSDSLRDQLSEKFATLGLLKEFNLVLPRVERPVVGILREQIAAEELGKFINSCNVVITTMAGIVRYPSSIQKWFSEVFPYYFIDEAHHVKAKTWAGFVDKFDNSRVVQFTATPFRNDGAKLDGEIIFNYPLLFAQKEGYFTKINYLPVFEIRPDKADEVIADKAVEIWQERCAAGYAKQIIMARCENKGRAREVFEIYNTKYPGLAPVLIFSGTGISNRERREAIERLRTGAAKVVVCVDMLGEGFDLPTLKIAALHDVKKSLTVTLQLIGRFTRTKFDEDLGEASFVTNIADLSVGEELERLYSQDADWNELLPEYSAHAIEKEVAFGEFISGFSIPDEIKIPLQNLHPALSTVVYRNPKGACDFGNYQAGISLGTKDNAWAFLNKDEQVQIIVIARREALDWGNVQNIENIVWDLLVIINDKENHLLYINGSDNSGIYAPLAEALLGEKPIVIRHSDPFRAFHNIKRVRLQNVGLKQFVGRNIRFRMSVGSDVGEALSIVEKSRGQKAFVVGTGYEDGTKVTLGCSYKGRIWTLQTGSIKRLAEWCKHIGEKVCDPSINGDEILKETLVPELVSKLPDKQCVWIDWNESTYDLVETKTTFQVGGTVYYLSDTSISLVYEKCDSSKIVVALEFLSASSGIVKKYEIEMRLGKDDQENAVCTYQLVNKSTPISVNVGRRSMSIEDFFLHNEPNIYYTDGSCLSGNEYVELKAAPGEFSSERIEAWDWKNVDLNKESQGVVNFATDSIQYHVIQQIRDGGYSVIYDDDNAGEIADIIAIKETEEKIQVDLFHLKFAKEGKVSTRIDNLYEVCGQAQKSVHWKFKDNREFFKHLYRRITKRADGQTGSRLVIGNEQDLQRLETLVKVKLPVEYSITIVQPGLSAQRATDDQKLLLAVTEQYLLDVANIKLRVIGNVL